MLLLIIKNEIPIQAWNMVIRGKQEDARYCFGLVVQSAFTEKRLAKLTKSLQVGGKNGGNDKGNEVEQKIGRLQKIVSNHKTANP